MNINCIKAVTINMNDIFLFRVFLLLFEMKLFTILIEINLDFIVHSTIKLFISYTKMVHKLTK